MATVNLGSIKFKWKGTYAGGTAYTIDDVVSYNGSSYICIQASTGNLPTDTAYFEQMSQAGTDGTDLTATLTTQGDILYRDGSGLQKLGAGTSGQVLKTGGTGANPSWGTVAGGNTVLLGDTTITSAVTSVDFTNIFDDATYGYYKIMVDGLQRMYVTGGGSNNTWCGANMYYTDASGNDISLSPSMCMAIRIARDYSGGSNQFDSIEYTGNSFTQLINEAHNGSDEGTGIFMMGHLFNPENTALFKQFFFESATQRSVSLDGSKFFNFKSAHSFDCTTAIKGVKFTDPISSYIRGGRIRIWGIKH